MAVKEHVDKAGKEWTTFTGEDLPKAKGLLTKGGEEAYKQAFHKNEGQYERITDPNGNPTDVHKRDVEQALAQGYGKVGLTPTFVVPQLPWKRKYAGPGRHVYKYNKVTKQMEAV